MMNMYFCAIIYHDNKKTGAKFKILCHYCSCNGTTKLQPSGKILKPPFASVSID